MDDIVNESGSIFASDFVGLGDQKHWWSLWSTLSTEFSGCKGNCIYFTDEKNIGAFYLENQKIDKILDYKAQCHPFWPPPSWLSSKSSSKSLFVMSPVSLSLLIVTLISIRLQGYSAVRPGLDLVEQEDQITHEISLQEEIDPEIALDIFKPDPNFLENEKRYEELKKTILGDESEDEEGSDAASDDDEDEDEDDDEEEDEEQMKIRDETETNLVNLRRTIYLTIMSSVDFEEAGHKLLKIKLEPGQEMELNIMLLECCSQERTYLRYYGLLGQRFCMINKVYQENFDKCFVQQYSMIHRLETNKLRNVAKFFAHLLCTDALPWHVLAYIRLTEEDTTSSSRIFIKILFQELSEHLGIRLLNERLNDPTMQDSFESIFPRDNPRNTRFSINFFTSIGLGGITENLREYLKNMPRLIMQQEQESDSSGSLVTGSASSELDSSSSDESERDDRHKKRRRRD
ncbi:uncharacterized protein LOC111995749 [Quercus suber]